MRSNCLLAFMLVPLLLRCDADALGNQVGSQNSNEQSDQAGIATKMLGKWIVQLSTPGGELPFTLEVSRGSTGILTGLLRNGPETIEVATSIDENSLIVDFPHYDSRLVLEPNDTGSKASGSWTKTRGAGKQAVMEAVAHRRSPAFDGDVNAFTARWRIEFADADEPAVGIFETDEGNGRIRGTILTTTGDYRFLSGGVIDGELILSCFDGGHAFLFRLQRVSSDSESGSNENNSSHRKLSGTFYSGNWYEVAMTAVEDTEATLPDGFAATKLSDTVELSDLKYSDPSGKLIGLNSIARENKVTVIELFGSWCPNCHDEAILLKQLHQEYADQGMGIIGLAFELTADAGRSWQQIDRYRQRYDVDYPLLLAGTSDKAAASEVFPIIDKVRSFPTTLFVDRSGKVRSVYSGFAGPATGAKHKELVQRFRRTIENLLAE